MKGRAFLVLACPFACAAHAQVPASIDVPTVSVTGSPSTTAPTATPMAETQPTSIVGRSALDAFVAPTGNYDEAIRLSPSVLAIAPNGPGLGEDPTITIRGFADGQYNVTFDGIPFADSDDFTHHSSAYVVTGDLASVTVDRGPGDAATIGDATFGGTVALASISPMSGQPTVSLSGTAGAFGTTQGGLLLETGKAALPGASAAVLGVTASDSDGALDGGAQRRETLFGKLVVPLGPATTLTLVGNLSDTGQSEPVGATRDEIARFGPAVALTDDPGSQAYEGYNNSPERTDIAYARLVSTMAGSVPVSDTLYTYGLYRRLEQGLDPNGETPNGTAFGPDDVPGESGRNGLRAWGDILRMAVPIGPALTFDAGAWAERQTNSRFLLETDRTLGDTPNPILPPVPGIPGSGVLDRLQRETLVTAQPYVQLAWRATPSLTVTAGVKGAIFDRAVEAPVMQGTRVPAAFDRTTAAPVPSLAARRTFGPHWSLYAQAARGFLAPTLEEYDVDDPAHASVPPETTWNFQAGANYRANALTLSADLYEILFDDAIGSRTIGNQTVDYNAGGILYRGIETELTRALGDGFSLYGNASAETSRESGTNTGPAPATPQATLTGGLLYRQGAWDASLIDHWVGGEFGDVDRQSWIDPFNQLDASAGAIVKIPHAGHLALRAQLFNLLDSRKIDGFAGYTVAAGTPLFWTQAGLSLFVSATASF
jgi:iron complex outermembrane receptor protein